MREQQSRFGPSANQDVWQSILRAGGNTVSHELRCSVIRTIAKAVLAHAGHCGALSEQDEELEEAVNSLVTEWQRESIPTSTNLASALGDDIDYFRRRSNGWSEDIGLTGYACPAVSDITWDLQGLLSVVHDRETITEQSVEDFYDEWRASFLGRVLREAELLQPGS